MKKNLFYLGTLALIVAGSIFWSCQKEEMLVNPEGVMLKSKTASDCNTCVSAWTESLATYTLLEKTEIPAGYVKLDVYNAGGVVHFKLYGNSHAGTLAGKSYNVTIDGVRYPASGNIDITGDFATWTVTKATWAKCTQVSISELNVNGLNTHYGTSKESLPFVYYMQELCSGCDDIFASAYAGDTEGQNSGEPSQGFNNAWWFAFDTEGDVEQNINAMVAGEIEVIGTATLEDGILTLDIGDWELQDVDEPVKYYLYNSLPTEGRPTPGQADNKGSSLEIDTDGNRYVVVHLDVTTCR
jgi:hypothetical protein